MSWEWLHVSGPLRLGTGRRLFDDLGPEHIKLERVRVLAGERLRDGA